MAARTETSICCDAGNANMVVDSPYPAHYTLELKSINTGVNTGSFEYAVGMIPLLQTAKHFCNFECLKQWLNSIS